MTVNSAKIRILLVDDHIVRAEDLQRVLAHAAEQSFQAIAIIPVILFVIFGAVWFFERRNRLLGDGIEPATQEAEA